MYYVLKHTSMSTHTYIYIYTYMCYTNIEFMIVLAEGWREGCDYTMYYIF